MIKIVSEATRFLVDRIQGSNVKAVVTDEATKGITVRIEESTLKIIEDYVEQTGWARNTVIAFLLHGGIELVASQLQQDEEQQSLSFGKSAGKR